MGAEGDSAKVDRVTLILQQGDYTLGDHWFAFRFDPAHPLSVGAKNAAAANSDVDLADVQIRGLVIVTQTCDLVRSCEDRPFVELCPLVEVDPAILADVRFGRRPNYALIPGAEARAVVADLDRTMTVEKPVMVDWSWETGCRDDVERRAFAQALARKRQRTAFPNEFNGLVRRLQDRIKEKHGKQSEEGEALRALREIRITATPSWEEKENAVSLYFWFIRHDADDERRWDDLLTKWLGLLKPSGHFNNIDGSVVTLKDMTAAEYIGSDQLDLDHLSTSG